jgi:cysteinyl-tRNA synthetase
MFVLTRIVFQEALKKYHGRQIRLLFLLHNYNSVMNYSEKSMSEVVEKDRQYSSFFSTLNAFVRERANETTPEKWTALEKKLNESLDATTNEVHEALVDNMDTPRVFAALDRLKTETYHYFEQSKGRESLYLIESIAAYFTRMFKIFGLVQDEIGFTAGGSHQIDPFLDIIAKFRDDVREIARNKEIPEAQRLVRVLQLSDLLRDTVLPDVGIKLEDRVGQPSVWKLYPPEELAKDRELAREAEQKRLAAKQEQEARAKVPPQELFTRDAQFAGYKFDEQGLPITDKEGKAVSKGQRSKFEKMQSAQAKRYNDWLEKQKQ